MVGAPTRNRRSRSAGWKRQLAGGRAPPPAAAGAGAFSASVPGRPAAGAAGRPAAPVGRHEGQHAAAQRRRRRHAADRRHEALERLVEDVLAVLVQHEGRAARARCHCGRVRGQRPARRRPARGGGGHRPIRGGAGRAAAAGAAGGSHAPPPASHRGAAGRPRGSASRPRAGCGPRGAASRHALPPAGNTLPPAGHAPHAAVVAASRSRSAEAPGMRCWRTVSTGETMGRSRPSRSSRRAVGAGGPSSQPAA